MRRLTFLLTAAALFAVASLPALADGGPSISAGAGLTAGSSPAGNVRNLHWFAGSVTAVGDGTLGVGVLWTGPNDGSLNGQTVTVAVSDHTRINGPRHRPIALADIQAGDLVAVRAAGDSTAGFTAAKIRLFCNCHWIGGTIGSIGSGSFTVDVKRTGPYDTVLHDTTVTLQVDSHTVYLAGRRHARLGFSDLKAGEGVGVVFSANGFFKAPGFDPTKATFVAKRVHVWGARQVPQPSTDATLSAGVSAG